MLTLTLIALTQATLPVTPNAWHLLGEGLILGSAVFLKGVWDDRKTKKHTVATKTERNAELDQRTNRLREAIEFHAQDIRAEVREVAATVKDLSAHVIGPDGQNGLRSEVRDIKLKVDGLLDREPRRRRR